MHRRFRYLPFNVSKVWKAAMHRRTPRNDSGPEIRAALVWCTEMWLGNRLGHFPHDLIDALRVI
jgi:hypothetical protein